MAKFPNLGLQPRKPGLAGGGGNAGSGISVGPEKRLGTSPISPPVGGGSQRRESPLSGLLQPFDQQSPINLISMISQAGVQRPEALAALLAKRGAPVPAMPPLTPPGGPGIAQPTPLPNPKIGEPIQPIPLPNPGLSPNTPITSLPVTQPVAPIGGITAPAVIDPRTGKQLIPGQSPGPLAGSTPSPASGLNPALIAALLQLVQRGSGGGQSLGQLIGGGG